VPHPSVCEHSAENIERVELEGKSEGLLPRTGDKRASILSSIDRIAVGSSTNQDMS